MRINRSFDCSIAGSVVEITWRSGMDLLAPRRPHLRCSERDCQYVDRNEPPCPLRVAMLDDESYHQTVGYLQRVAGTRRCYRCVTDTLQLTHEQVRRALWRIQAEMDLLVRPGRCAECRRRGTTITMPGNAVAAVVPIAPTARTAPTAEDDGEQRMLEVLRTHDVVVCAACAAFAVGVPLLEARRLIAKLSSRRLLSTREGTCDQCGRAQAVAWIDRAEEHRAPA